MPRRVDDRAEDLASGVGWVSLGIGLALTLAPRGSAAFLGWGDREGLSRVIGASDLVLGMGLLLDRDRPRWMLARALLNALLALIYAAILNGGTPHPKRAGGWLGLMAFLTAFDYRLSRRLRRS